MKNGVVDDNGALSQDQVGTITSDDKDSQPYRVTSASGATSEYFRENEVQCPARRLRKTAVREFLSTAGRRAWRRADANETQGEELTDATTTGVNNETPCMYLTSLAKGGSWPFCAF